MILLLVIGCCSALLNGSHLFLEAYLFSCTSTLLLGATRVSSGPRMHFLLGHRSD